MNHISKLIAVLSVLIGFSVPAHAKTDGILVVGTQKEVKAILSETSLRPRFSEENADALVAVSLTKGKMVVHEGEPVKDIVKFVGKVVKGGVVFTLDAGSELWEVVKDCGGFVMNVGETALKAACKVLCHTSALVVDGVKFVAKTSVGILRAIGDLLLP